MARVLLLLLLMMMPLPCCDSHSLALEIWTAPRCYGLLETASAAASAVIGYDGSGGAAAGVHVRARAHACARACARSRYSVALLTTCVRLLQNGRPPWQG